MIYSSATDEHRQKQIGNFRESKHEDYSWNWKKNHKFYYLLKIHLIYLNVITILHALPITHYPIYSPSEEWRFWEHRTILKFLAFSNKLTTMCQFLSVESNVFIRRDTSDTRSLHLENECAQIINMLMCTKAVNNQGLPSSAKSFIQDSPSVPKRQAPISQWHGAISQKNGDVNCTASKT